MDYPLTAFIVVCACIALFLFGGKNVRPNTGSNQASDPIHIDSRPDVPCDKGSIERARERSPLNPVEKEFG